MDSNESVSSGQSSAGHWTVDVRKRIVWKSYSARLNTIEYARIPSVCVTILGEVAVNECAREENWEVTSNFCCMGYLV